MSDELLIINLIIKFCTSIFCVYNAVEIVIGLFNSFFDLKAESKKNEINRLKIRIKLSIVKLILYISICITPILFAINLFVEMDFEILYQINMFFGVLTAISLVILVNEVYLNEIKHSQTIKMVYIYSLIILETLTLISSFLRLTDVIFVFLLLFSLIIFTLYITLLIYSIKLYRYLKKEERNQVKEISYIKSMILMFVFLTLFLIVGIITIDMEGNINQLGEVINGIILILSVFYSYKTFVKPSQQKRKNSNQE